MVTDDFKQISNWPGAAPVVDVRFEIFGRDKKPRGTYSKRFLFDTGNEGGIMLSDSHIREFGLGADDLDEVNILSPGNSGKTELCCFVSIQEINLNGQNILEEPIRDTLLVFSSNVRQTPIIGQDCFSEFECCVDFKAKKFSVNRG